MRCAVLLLALALLPPAPGVARAAATPIALTPVAKPAIYKPAGRPLELLGIAPGMTPDAVRDILTKAYGNAVVTQDDIGLDNRGVTAHSQPFISKIAAQRENDEIVVWFGTPTTGNGVVEVSRQLSFRDETAAPPMQQVRADLLERYGKPGFDGPAVGTGEVLLMAWSFNGDKPNPCPRSSCRAQLSEGLDVRNLPAYARSTKAGNDLTIVATLLSGISDPSKASGIVVVLSDAATKFRTLDAAIAQLRTATTRKGGQPED